MERCIKTRYNVEEAIQYVIELSEYSELPSLESDCDDEDLIIQDVAAEWQLPSEDELLGNECVQQECSDTAGRKDHLNIFSNGKKE